MNIHFTPEIGPQEGIIRPRRTKTDPPVDPDVILAFVKTDLDYLISLFPNQKTQSYDQGFFRFFKLFFDHHAGLTLAGPMLGAPQAVMVMEKLIALGGRRFWALGWCGSLQPEIKIGNFIVPTHAVCEEGTSAHYPIPQANPETDPELGARLVDTLRADRVAYYQGPVWTTDAPYRETPLKIKTYRQKEILAVEMEMSALITLALFRAVKVAGLLVVSDELAGLKWKPGFHSPALKNGSQLACRSLLKAIGIPLALTRP
jgi:uridine phosphorylase